MPDNHKNIPGSDTSTSFFDKYPYQGRKLLGRPTGFNARRDYGPQVAQHSGWFCAYCGRDLLSSYESWLDLQVDHVVPQYLIKDGYPEDWVYDMVNCVICCAACNGFLNGYRIKSDGSPATEEAFFDLRDRVFCEKKKLSIERHKEERLFWEQLVKQQKDKATIDPQGM